MVCGARPVAAGPRRRLRRRDVGLALFEPVLDRIRYVGVDVSTAVDVAARRFAERGVSAAFLQADLTQLPLPPESFDLIFSEGVLHHTDDTRAALTAVVQHLKPGGRILFYVYRTRDRSGSSPTTMCATSSRR